MKATLLAFDSHDGKSVELPEYVTSYHQVKPLGFKDGTLWLVVLEPSEVGGAQTQDPGDQKTVGGDPSS